jgi:hypothetical protein
MERQISRSAGLNGFTVRFGRWDAYDFWHVVAAPIKQDRAATAGRECSADTGEGGLMPYIDDLADVTRIGRYEDEVARRTVSVKEMHHPAAL